MERNENELIHYGVPGMKWGHRKSSSVMNARRNFKQAKKEERNSKVRRVFSKSTYVAGYGNTVKNTQSKKRIENAKQNREKAAFKYIDTQAKYAYDKKFKNTGNKSKAEKAAMKVHSKAFAKGKYGSGLVGSMADSKTKGNARYFDHLKATKGKEYAINVEKKYRNKVIGALAGSTVVAGAMFIDMYLKNK